MKIPKDKQYHIVAGALVALITTMIYTSPVAGAVTGCLAGFAKEGFDYLHNRYLIKRNRPPAHNVEILDCTFTAIGAVITAVALSPFM